MSLHIYISIYLYYSGFLMYHLYQVYWGCTTNEMFKWSYVKKYYNKLVVSHQKYLDREKSKQNTDSNKVSDDIVAIVQVPVPVNCNVDVDSIISETATTSTTTTGTTGTTTTTTTNTELSSMSKMAIGLSSTDDMNVGCISGGGGMIPMPIPTPTPTPTPTDKDMYIKPNNNIDTSNNTGNGNNNNSNGNNNSNSNKHTKKDKKKNKNKNKNKTNTTGSGTELTVREVDENDENAQDIPEFLKDPPGEYPVNIYNQGFTTNLYYFIFPKSMLKLSQLNCHTTNKLKEQ